MSIKQINQSISSIGVGFLASIKYGLFQSYDRYDYIASLSTKKDILQNKTYSTLYKQIPKK